MKKARDTQEKGIHPDSKTKRSQSNNKRRLLRITEVIHYTGCSRSYIYELARTGRFPKSIQLVRGGTSVAWVEEEVFDWIESRIKERDQGVA